MRELLTFFPACEPQYLRSEARLTLVVRPIKVIQTSAVGLDGKW